MRHRPPLIAGLLNKKHVFDNPVTALQFLEGRDRVTRTFYIPPQQLILLPSNYLVCGLRPYYLVLLQVINWSLRIHIKEWGRPTYAEIRQLYNIGLTMFPQRFNDTKCIVDSAEQSIRGILSPRRKYYSLYQMFSVFLENPLIQDNYRVAATSVIGPSLEAVLQPKGQKDRHVICHLNEAAQSIAASVYRRKERISHRKVKISAAVLKHLPAAIESCLVLV